MDFGLLSRPMLCHAPSQGGVVLLTCVILTTPGIEVLLTSHNCAIRSDSIHFERALSNASSSSPHGSAPSPFQDHPALFRFLRPGLGLAWPAATLPLDCFAAFHKAEVPLGGSLSPSRSFLLVAPLYHPCLCAHCLPACLPCFIRRTHCEATALGPLCSQRSLTWGLRT